MQMPTEGDHEMGLVSLQRVSVGGIGCFKENIGKLG